VELCATCGTNPHHPRRCAKSDGNGSRAELTAESDPRSGFGVWAASYDEPGNPIVALEQPAVRALIDRLAPRRALDAACGTGRHAARLKALGHQVEGFDLTPEMLATARVNVPDYLTGLAVAGLTVEQLIEPRLTEAHTRAKRRASRVIPDATIEAYAGLPGVLVLEATKS
jgi:SAM-dependent methyltransferase